MRYLGLAALGLCAVLMLMVVAPLTAAPNALLTPTNTAQVNVRQRMKSIRNYVIYYGKGRLEDLAKYDLAIIQPETLTADELARLKARPTPPMVVAYLSIGEVEPGRAWYRDGRVPEGWLLGINRNWGSYYVDARQRGWQLLMKSLLGEYLALGFDGIFMDTVDTVDVFPQTQPGMVSLIESLRQAHPDALMIQNRGFTIASQVAWALDGLMFEGVSTTYAFNTGEYKLVDNSKYAQSIRDLSDSTRLPILALDYVPPDRKQDARKVADFARAMGFIPAISTIKLDDIPDYGLDETPTP